MGKVYNIVITGGPCAGKTSAMARIQEELVQKGYKVIVVEEEATLAINRGIVPWEIDGVDFQEGILKLQINKENVVNELAKKYDKDVVIVMDRGALDSKAYVSRERFKEVLSKVGETENSLMERYGAVIHLVTAAKGAEEFYTLSNNSARTEGVEVARQRDEECLGAWVGHEHLRVVGNETNFEGKLDRLMGHIYSYLGIPVPVEIERKYLIKLDNLDDIIKRYDAREISIMQTYISCEENEEERVRQRGVDGDYAYIWTKKTKISELERIEIQRRISKEEYLEKLMSADLDRKTIIKSRYCFVYKNQYFELDVYKGLENGILEIELTDKQDSVELPPEIELIKEVTGDMTYKNAEIAKIN